MIRCSIQDTHTHIHNYKQTHINTHTLSSTKSQQKLKRATHKVGEREENKTEYYNIESHASVTNKNISLRYIQGIFIFSSSY